MCNLQGAVARQEDRAHHITGNNGLDSLLPLDNVNQKLSYFQSAVYNGLSKEKMRPTIPKYHGESFSPTSSKGLDWLFYSSNVNHEARNEYCPDIHFSENVVQFVKMKNTVNVQHLLKNYTGKFRNLSKKVGYLDLGMVFFERSVIKKVVMAINKMDQPIKSVKCLTCLPEPFYIAVLIAFFRPYSILLIQADIPVLTIAPSTPVLQD